MKDKTIDEFKHYDFLPGLLVAVNKGGDSALGHFIRLWLLHHMVQLDLWYIAEPYVGDILQAVISFDIC